MFALFRPQVQTIRVLTAQPAVFFSTAGSLFNPAKKTTTKKAAAKPKKEVNTKKPSIKRPASAYSLYVKDQFKTNSAELMSYSFNDRAKLLSQRWSSLSSTEKQPYVAAHASDLARYETEKLEAAKKAPPKRPLGAYFSWVNTEREYLKQAHPEASVTELAKIAGEKWRSLPDFEKSEFEAKSKTEMEAWKSEYAKWKATAAAN